MLSHKTVVAESDSGVAECGETEDYEFLFGQVSFQELKHCMALRINLDRKPKQGQKKELFFDQNQLRSSWTPFVFTSLFKMKDGVPPSCLFLKSSGFLQQGD
jgi:hypothetical protein